MLRAVRLIGAVIVGCLPTAASAAQTLPSAPVQCDRLTTLNGEHTITIIKSQETAIQIAEAALFPIYGEAAIRRQRPYDVTFTPTMVTVKGTNSTRARALKPPRIFVGGNFTIKLCRGDGTIVSIEHTR